MSDIRTQLRSYLETTPEVTFDEIMMAAAPSTGGEAEMVRPRSQQTGPWRGPLIAVGTAVAILLVVVGSLLVFGGDGIDVVDEPIPATQVPPVTTIPEIEATSPVVGAWNPILSTTVAREAPAAATCPDGTYSDVSGPVGQVRPGTEGMGVVSAVFDQHAGRIVYVNRTHQTWTFDVCTNTWHQVHPTGTAPDFWFGGLVYDVDSDVTVALGPKSVYVYNADTNSWTRPANDRLGYGTDDISPYGGAYDPVTGLIITSNQRRTPETRTNAPIALEFWAYDVDTNEWTLLGPLRLEPSHKDMLELLGYSEQLDQLILTGGIDGEEATILVDPRTGDVTVLPIESPGIDIGWPNGTYGTADGTVYAATRNMTTPDDICGFDANTKSWTACFDGPSGFNVGRTPFPSLVGDPINNRLILINTTPAAQGTANSVGAIDLDTGESTQILTPATP